MLETLCVGVSDGVKHAEKLPETVKQFVAELLSEADNAGVAVTLDVCNNDTVDVSEPDTVGVVEMEAEGASDGVSDAVLEKDSTADTDGAPVALGKPVEERESVADAQKVVEDDADARVDTDELRDALVDPEIVFETLLHEDVLRLGDTVPVVLEDNDTDGERKGEGDCEKVPQ